MKNLIKFTLIASLTIINTFLQGYVLCKLFNWLISPVFSLKQITLPEAIGTSVVIHFLMLPIITNLPNSDEDRSIVVMTIVKAIVCWVMYLYALGVGFIVSQYI